MTHTLRITLAQIDPVVGGIAANAAKIRKARASAPAGTDLIVFPELVLCGYPPEDLVLNPFFLDRIDAELKALAAKDGPWMIVPAPHRRDGKIFNAAYIVGGGKIQAVTLKHDLPNYGVFDEKRVFAAGPLPEPVTIAGHKIGILICEDMWTPGPAAHLKKNGAELLIYVNGSPYETTKHANRLTAAKARVRETGLPLIYVNQTGGQDDLVFDGASFVLNEKGTLLLQAAPFAADTHHTIWEKTGNGHWLCTADTIIPYPDETESVYRALVLGLRDYVHKNGFPGVLIGLSGGIDSALTATIAVDALGKDAVHGVLMPSRFTSKESTEDAEKLSENLGIHYDTIPIETIVSAFERELQRHLTPGIAHENLQSRSRGVILMALSNATGKMVLTTGNKSEMAVGYATLYGDMCGGFNALKDVYKTKVYELSRWRNAQADGPVIPERSITKAPTAELRPNQTDQDSLPPYDILDAILEGLIEDDRGPDDFPDQDPETVRAVARLLDRAEYKRRQSAPGTKITPRAFGRDRRYPITNILTFDEKKGAR